MQKLLIFLRDVQLDWIDADPSIARSEGNQRLMTSMRWTSAYIVVTGYNRLSVKQSGLPRGSLYTKQLSTFTNGEKSKAIITS